MASASYAQTSFTANVTPNPAGKEDYITVKLTVNNGTDIKQINPPALNDFNIVSGPNQESEMSTMNGITKQAVSVSYILFPKKPGSFSLGVATATIGGKTYRSAPINVTVLNKRSGGQSNNNQVLQSPFAAFDPFDVPQEQSSFSDYVLRKGESIPDKVNKNMQLRLQTDKTSCYIGEPVVATYKLYSRLRSESTLSKNPSFNGFSVVDMTEGDPVSAQTRETLNGREYNAYTIRKAQLYPLQSGTLALESASLDNRIEFYKDNGSNSYGTGDVVTQNVTLSSKPVMITVKPLPEEGKPASFKGAVGNFTIDASLEKNNFSSDETGKLLLTITGSGNMHLLTVLDIKWADGIEAFDVKSIDKTNDKTVPISGSKTFEIPFATEHPGKFLTPSVNFSFFDPGSGTYKMLYAEPLSFTVTKGTGKQVDVIKNNTKETRSFLSSISGNIWPGILLLVGVIISGLIFWMSKERRKVSLIEPETFVDSNTIASASPDFILQNPLTKTEECLAKTDCVEFYSILNGEMREFLSKRFGLVKEGMNHKNLSAAMDRAGVDIRASMHAQDLLRDIEWQLYTPFEQNEEVHRMYARAQTIVQQMSIQPS